MAAAVADVARHTARLAPRAHLRTAIWSASAARSGKNALAVAGMLAKHLSPLARHPGDDTVSAAPRPAALSAAMHSDDQSANDDAEHSLFAAGACLPAMSPFNGLCRRDLAFLPPAGDATAGICRRHNSQPTYCVRWYRRRPNESRDTGSSPLRRHCRRLRRRDPRAHALRCCHASCCR